MPNLFTTISTTNISAVLIMAFYFKVKGHWWVHICLINLLNRIRFSGNPIHYGRIRDFAVNTVNPNHRYFTSYEQSSPPPAFKVIEVLAMPCRCEKPSMFTPICTLVISVVLITVIYFPNQKRLYLWTRQATTYTNIKPFSVQLSCLGECSNSNSGRLSANVYRKLAKLIYS